MLDFLSADAPFASEILARTASTARVQSIVQLSLAPVFLLASIGALLNVMNGRLIWIVDRVERLEKLQEDGRGTREIEELPALWRRRKYAHIAINLSTAAALDICAVVALMFISAFVRPALGSFVAFAWVMAMALVFSSLLLFLMETQLATRSARDRRRLSRKITQQQEEDQRQSS